MNNRRYRVRRVCTGILIAALLITAAAFPASAAETGKMDLETFSAGAARLHQKYDSGSGMDLSGEKSSGISSARLILKAESVPKISGALEVFGGYQDYYLAQFADEREAEKALKELSETPGVQCAAPDAEMTLLSDPGTLQYQSLKKWSDDPDPIGAQALNERIAQKYDQVPMPEMIIAALDSGVEMTHPLLQEHLLPGYDVGAPDAVVTDEFGHGTFVAGVIASIADPNIRILPIKVTDQYGKIPISYAVAGIEKALESGAGIINMSFGAEGVNAILEGEVAHALACGAVIVAAAGNDRKDAGLYYPAGYDGVVTVSNLMNADTLNANSNRGACVELAAPGTAIYSAALDGGTKYMSGTSFSAPFVSAAAAMAAVYAFDSALQSQPDALQGVEILCRCAADIGKPGIDDSFGCGRLDLSEIQTPISAPPPMLQVGESRFSGESAAAGDGWSYSAETQELILTDYHGGPIWSNSNLTIRCFGETEINGTDSAAVWVEGDLTLLIEGAGAQIRGGDGEYGGDGVYVQGNLCLSDISDGGVSIAGGQALSASKAAGVGVCCPLWGSELSAYSAVSLQVSGGASAEENCTDGAGVRACRMELNASGSIVGGGDAPAVLFTEQCRFGPFPVLLSAGPYGTAAIADPCNRLTPIYSDDCFVDSTTPETVQISPIGDFRIEMGAALRHDADGGVLDWYLPVQLFTPEGSVLLACYRNGRLAALSSAAFPESGKAVSAVQMHFDGDEAAIFSLNGQLLPTRGKTSFRF